MFPRYFLGPDAAGKPLEATGRTCDRHPARGEPVRANFWFARYDTCDACTIGVQVQTWPACERNASSVATTPQRRIRVRGAPAAILDGRVEIYTGRVTIVLFAQSTRAALKQGRFLRTVGHDRPKVSPGERLPAPTNGALEGHLKC